MATSPRRSYRAVVFAVLLIICTLISFELLKVSLVICMGRSFELLKISLVICTVRSLLARLACTLSVRAHISVFRLEIVTALANPHNYPHGDALA